MKTICTALLILAAGIVLASSGYAWGLVSSCWEGHPATGCAGETLPSMHRLQNMYCPEGDCDYWVQFEMIDDGGIATYTGDELIYLPFPTEQYTLPITLNIPDDAYAGDQYSYAFQVKQVVVDSGGGIVIVPGYNGGCQVLVTCPSRPVWFDIKPGSCPNLLNVKAPKIDIWVEADETPIASKSRPDRPQEAKAVLPAAILGTADFDITDIDPATVMLEGVLALRWNIEDVSTPVGEEAEECECTTEGADGYPDLTLKFDRSLIVEALGEVYDGDTIPLTITGVLTDGTPFEGTDCVVIVGGPPPAEGAANSDESTEVDLIGNYPNPFNPTTEISFSLPAASHVKLEVYNIMGQKVATLVDGRLEAGEHIVQWDGSETASGVYLYRLQADDFVDTKKMILLK